MINNFFTHNLGKDIIIDDQFWLRGPDGLSLVILLHSHQVVPHLNIIIIITIIIIIIIIIITASHLVCEHDRLAAAAAAS